MPFQMGYSKQELSGGAPLPDGWYKFQFCGFKPKAAGANKDSVSLNAEFEVIQHPEHAGRKVYANLNSKAGWIIQDFIHACALEMEEDSSGNYTIPGVFDGSDQYPDDPQQWKYQGPLTNKVFEAEVGTDEYQGKKRAAIRQYHCAVSGCQERHSTNLLK